jgi:outer membrane receptor protein involved in Fe transport
VLLLKLAIIASLTPPLQPLIVIDDAGRPLSGAHVVFTGSRGERDVETSDATGRAAPRAGFEPIAADVSKPGFLPSHVSLNGSAARVALERALPVVGSVTVATGSQQNLHESPLAASVLDASAIALAPAATSDRLLRQLPGSDATRSNSAFTNYGLLRASFSGTGNDRGVVLVDGFPAQDAFGGQIDWEAYPSDAIVREELLRGAGSALYGSGGVGGVLDVSTFAPRTGAGPADGFVRLSSGTDAAADEALLLRAPLGPALGVSLATTIDRLEYLDLPPGYASPVDRPATGESASTNAKVRYAAGGTTVDGGVTFSSDHQNQGRENYTFDRTFRQENLTASHHLGSAVATLGLYDRDTTVYNLDDLAPAEPGKLRYIQHVPAHEDGFFGTLLDAPGPVQYELRVDQRRVDGESEQYGPTGALTANGTGSELEQGIALQTTYRTHRFEALAGVRADRLRYDDLSLTKTVSASPAPYLSTTSVAGHDEGAISPRVALRYDIGERFALRVSSGGGFRGPYLNELVRGFNVGSVVEAPNPNLVPERSRTDDLGLDDLIGSGRLAFDVFQTHVNDAIDFVTVSPTLQIRENVDHTQTNGETLTFAQPLGACTRARASGTTQYARVTAGPPGTPGKRPEYVPAQSADIGLDAAGRGPLSYSVDAAYVGQEYADDLNTEPLGTAILLGATVRAATSSGTTFSLIADNLTDATYLSSVDRYGPPLIVRFRVDIPIGPVRRNAAACGFPVRD